MDWVQLFSRMVKPPPSGVFSNRRNKAKVMSTEVSPTPMEMPVLAPM